MENIFNRSKDDFVVLYKNEDLQFRIYDYYSKELSTGDYPYNRRIYHMFKGYSLSDEGLKEFAKDFSNWSYDLRELTFNQ